MHGRVFRLFSKRLKAYFWFVDYIDPVTHQRRRVKAGATKDQALAKLVELKRLVAPTDTVPVVSAGEPKPAPALPPTFAEVIPQYMAWARANKSSWDRDLVCLNRLAGVFGKCRLNEVTAAMVEQFKLDRLGAVTGHTGRPPSPRQINYELQILRAFYNRAKLWDLTTSNPMDKVKLFRLKNQRLRYLDRKEVDALLDACTGRLAHIKAPFIVAVHTGARIGEILALRWTEIDLANGLIHFRETKNGRPRSLPMNQEVREAIRSVISVDHVLEKTASDSFVFLSNRSGDRYQSIRAALTSAAKKAGLRGVTWHVTRHTAASWMVMAGVPLPVVAEYLGHRSLAMVMRYAHLAPDTRRAAADALQKVFGRAPATGVDEN